MPGSNSLETIGVMLKNVEKDVFEVKEGIESIRKDVIPRLAKHGNTLMIMGAAITLLVPVIATWNYHLKVQLADINSKTIILQERMRHYEDSQSNSVGELGNWSFGTYTVQQEKSCLQPRATLEGESDQYFLYTIGNVQGGMELQSSFQKEYVLSY